MLQPGTLLDHLRPYPRRHFVPRDPRSLAQSRTNRSAPPGRALKVEIIVDPSRQQSNSLGARLGVIAPAVIQRKPKGAAKATGFVLILALTSRGRTNLLHAVRTVAAAGGSARQTPRQGGTGGRRGGGRAGGAGRAPREPKRPAATAEDLDADMIDYHAGAKAVAA